MSTLEEWRALREQPDMRALVTVARKEIKPVTVNTKDGGTKTVEILYCPELPIKLARQAGTTVEAYSLARNMASEGYSGDDYALAMMVIGTVGKNVAMQKNPTAHFPITTLLTYSQYQAVRWRYGEQSGRWAATTQDPTRWHVLLAEAIIRGEIPDITQGGVKYVDPWPPGATQRGKPLPPFDQLMTVWHRTLAWRPIPGIETRALAVFAPEPDPVKRAGALASLLDEWRRMPRGREPRSEERSKNLSLLDWHGREDRRRKHARRMGGEAMAGVGADTPTAADLPRMEKELGDTEKLFVEISTQWPPGLKSYPTESTINLLSALLRLETALVNGIMDARQDVRQILINEEEWVRILNQLQRAAERVLPSLTLLGKARKKGDTVTDLPADFRDNVLKLLIEINSAMPAIASLKNNVPGLFVSILVGLFVVTGMGMASFFREAFTIVINGAIEIAAAAAAAVNKLRKFLIPDWVLWLGGATLVGGWLWKSKIQAEEEARYLNR